MMKYGLWILFWVMSSAFAKTLPLDQLTLPPGFHVEIFAKDVKDAREMTLGDKGTVFVGSTEAGNVYAITPEQNNSPPYQVNIIASHLNKPQGVAFYQGDLYVAEIDRLLRYKNIEQHLTDPPKPTLVTMLPVRKSESGEQVEKHSWKTIHFGPDGKLYVAIAMPCDSCLPENKFEGTISRMNPDGTHFEVYAKGLRNSVGFDWQPDTHALWFTDNGRDYLGDNIPPDKLCYAPRKGLDFGFPYYLGIDAQGKPIPNPDYKNLRSSKGITWEALNLPAHVAALNMVFYTGDMFPPQYKNQIFIAEHGSWNRSQKVGYRIVWITVKKDKALSYTPFMTGWEKNEKAWGRPVGLLVMPDGSLLISDDEAGVIYRISYRSR